MRHRVKGRALGRNPSHRRAMLRNMVTSLLEVERIETTDAKAKEVRSWAERIITLGKRGDLHARRRALRVVRKRDVVAKVFDELAERFKDRPGGYTRIIKVGIRSGDGAPVSILELLPDTEKAAAGKRTRRLRKAKTEKPAEEAAPKEEAKEEKKKDKKKEAKPKKETKKAAPKKKTSDKKETPKKKESAKKKEAAKKETKSKKTDTEKKAADKKETAKKKPDAKKSRASKTTKAKKAKSDKSK